MDNSDYRVMISDNDPEAASRVLGSLISEQVAASMVELLPSPEKLKANSDNPIIVIVTGGIHENRTRKFLEGIKSAPATLGVICLVEPTEPEPLNYFDRLGVDAVFDKPVQGDEVAKAASRLLERKKLIGSTRITGKTPPMRELIERVVQYSQVNSTVLISGESGTGKELVAQAVHRLGGRRHKQFIAVNCGAIAEGVLESELFGHEKGAFTGASSLRKGHFEIAHGGTIFLDEIGEMPLSVQVKLLRVLEEREIMRVGGSAKINVDVRVIAATNKNLEREVEQGRFRRDLFYRLKVLSILIPPLRERREDIPLLMNTFIEQFCRENNRSFAGIDDEAMEIMKNYDWPGNVRELRNLAESMVVLSLGSRIRARDIPENIFRKGNPDRLLPVHTGYQGQEHWERDNRGLEQQLIYIYQAISGLQKEMGDIKELLGGFRSSGYAPAKSSFVDDSFERSHDPDNDISGVGVVSFAEHDDDNGNQQQSMQEIERDAIEETLRSVGGNRRKAARILGIGERTLYRKLKDYDLN